MNAKKILALLLGAMMLLSLAACGAKDDKAADMNGNNTVMTGEAKNAEEALAMHKELMAQENALLSENTELWEKVFMAADKGMTMQEDGKNYGDFLLKTIEDAEAEKLRGTEVLAVNALRFAPHPSHFNLAEALALIRRVGPREAYITHMSHEIGLHAETEATLPPGVHLAYDGLEVEI